MRTRGGQFTGQVMPETAIVTVVVLAAGSARFCCLGSSSPRGTGDGTVRFMGIVGMPGILPGTGAAVQHR